MLVLARATSVAGAAFYLIAPAATFGGYSG